MLLAAWIILAVIFVLSLIGTVIAGLYDRIVLAFVCMVLDWVTGIGASVTFVIWLIQYIIAQVKA